MHRRLPLAPPSSEPPPTAPPKQQSKDPAVKAAARSADVPLNLRSLCAARLISLADSLDKQQAQYAGGKGGKGQAAQAEQAAAPRQEYLGGVAALVATLQQSGAATLATAGEGEGEGEGEGDNEAAMERAHQAAATLQAALGRMAAQLAGGSASAGQQQRLRALTHLLRLLLLHSLADPGAADPALAADLDTVLGLALEGRPAPAAAAAGISGGKGGSSGSDEEEGEEAAAPHWHDTLMDVLLSLLARNAAPLPSAPLRDAVEHVFRSFADDLTPTGAWCCLGGWGGSDGWDGKDAAEARGTVLCCWWLDAQGCMLDLACDEWGCKSMQQAETGACSAEHSRLTGRLQRTPPASPCFQHKP